MVYLCRKLGIASRLSLIHRARCAGEALGDKASKAHGPSRNRRASAFFGDVLRIDDTGHPTAMTFRVVTVEPSSAFTREDAALDFACGVIAADVEVLRIEDAARARW